jgi:hypothetical protein
LQWRYNVNDFYYTRACSFTKAKKTKTELVIVRVLVMVLVMGMVALPGTGRLQDTVHRVRVDEETGSILV